MTRWYGHYQGASRLGCFPRGKRGSVLSDNWAFAAQQALGIEREAARAHALRFGLRVVSTRFVASLVPVA